MNDLFFISSKVLWGLLQPTSILLWLSIAGVALLWTRFLKAGRRLLAGVLSVVLALGFLPVNELLASILENRFPVPRELPADIAGIVVLSGASGSEEVRRRGSPVLENTAERLTEALVLMRRFPRAKVFFSGYSGGLFYEGSGAAGNARLFFESQLGAGSADASRIQYEDRSRNTYENALHTKRMARPEPGETWLLVTSAMHVPRSVGVFRRLGWNVVAFPVDFRTGENQSFLPGWFSFQRLRGFDEAVREWVGLFAYYLADRTDALFPAS